MLVGMAEMAGGASTLPRHLYRAILRLLRPAESAARRLVIAAAQGIVVTLPPLRPRKPKPKIADTVAAMRRLGLAVTLSREDFARYEAERKAAERRAARPRTISLPLFDPQKYPFRVRRHYLPARGVPRIWVPGFSERAPLPPPPALDDPIDAARLSLRLAALGAPSTTCQDRQDGSPAGRRAATRRSRRCGRSAAPWSCAAGRSEARSASSGHGRCGWGVRRAAGCRPTIPPRRTAAASVRSMRFWRMPMRWPWKRWNSRDRTVHDGRHPRI
ncbi:hypothetical protein [Mesorhizobium sp. IMUNJ 23232]|uniref:hypothetical protein n=1 Tax=Mesorhizobium sp. IMUNJ 23232 TaxID=3376064 RepID=UPI0037A4D7C2